MATRKMIYLAAPLFNPMEREFNLKIAVALSEHAEVFLPQRDGKLLSQLLETGIAVDVAQTMIFSNDIVAIESCSMVVAVLDGRTVDEGVAFELGYARALGKTCVGFKTDTRNLLKSGDNPMIFCGCQVHCSSLEELLTEVKSLLNSDCGAQGGVQSF